jgi:hypothetical protein
MTTKQEKTKLIDHTILRIAVHGAFQRNNVYCRKLDKLSTKEFKEYLRDTLNDTIAKIVSRKRYTDDDHCRMIEVFAKKVSKRYSSCLTHGVLNIGTAQKMLNLFWKMKWVFYKDVPTPKHCPFDGIIIKKLDSTVSSIKWTRIDDISIYKELISAARNASGKMSIAEWELKLYTKDNGIAGLIGVE